MQTPTRPSTPRPQEDLDLPALPSTNVSPKNPSSPVRFATSKNAFGLLASPASSSSSSTREDRLLLLPLEKSPPSASSGPSTSKPRLRRPSMLSLEQKGSFEDTPRTGEGSHPPAAPPSSLIEAYGIPNNRTTRPSFSSNPFGPNPLRPPPQWGPSGFTLRNQQEARSNLTFEGLSTSTPPLGSSSMMEDQGTEGDMEDAPKEPLRWVPSHLQTTSARRKGKARMEDQLINDPSPLPDMHRPPFTGRLLHGHLDHLVDTLRSEQAPGDHEIHSEARFQRLLSSHPRALPFASRKSRGRYPEMVDDEEDDEFPNRRTIWAARAWTRRDSSSDSDSDDMMTMDEPPPDTVNSAFAAGMDMDRMTSTSASDHWQGMSESGRSTPGKMGSGGFPTPPSNAHMWEKSRPARMSFSGAGLVPSPGTGFGLPNAFGGLGMGSGTPLGSPTVEKLDLATSPGAHSTMSTASPSLMQYRESSGGSASVRPGKRKDDRFDPYKRPRGSSPSLSSSSAYPMSPSRSSAAIPIPQSPSYNLYSSMLSTGNSTPTQISGRDLNLRIKANHPYTHPMSSRSRAASPALSIGSTSGGLSSSLGTGGAAGRGSFSLAGPFGSGGSGSGAGGQNGMGQQGQGQGLGGLGLLSLANRGVAIKEDREGEDMSRTDSGMGSEMEED